MDKDKAQSNQFLKSIEALSERLAMLAKKRAGKRPDAA